jgi:multidrug transporter EmrE-like cation transporter
MKKNKSILEDYKIVYLILSLVFQSLAVYFGKAAAVELKEFAFSSIITSPNYLLSLACLGLQAFVWQLALRKYPLFLAYLFMSGIYGITLAVSVLFFHENATPGNILGTLIITAGIVFLIIGQKGKEYA